MFMYDIQTTPEFTGVTECQSFKPRILETLVVPFKLNFFSVDSQKLRLLETVTQTPMFA